MNIIVNKLFTNTINTYIIAQAKKDFISIINQF